MDFPKYTKGFRNLIVWQKAHQLSLLVYRHSNAFPQREQYTLTQQIRDAAASVGANIAEGSSRRTTKGQNSFYYIAKGSLQEVDNFTELAHDLGYLKDEQYKELLEYINKTGLLLNHLITRAKASTQQTQKTHAT